jgi:hypothetical protein
LERNRLASRCLDFIDDARGVFRALGIGDRDAGAVRGEALGDGGTDSARGARDKGDLGGQVRHQVLHRVSVGDPLRA